MGRSLEVGRKSEDLPAIALLLCSRDLERVCVIPWSGVCQLWIKLGLDD